MSVRLPIAAALATLTLWATPLGAQPEGSIATPEEGAPAAKEETCSGIVEAFARSGARKLFRAVDGHRIPIQTLDWKEQIDIPIDSDLREEMTFHVYREKEGKTLGLVQTGGQNRTFVVVHTTLGPVIASLDWPHLEVIDDRSECQPKGAKVEHPEVSIATIDVFPFEFWGLRVFWRLPASFNPDASPSDETSPREALEQILSSS